MAGLNLKEDFMAQIEFTLTLGNHGRKPTKIAVLDSEDAVNVFPNGATASIWELPIFTGNAERLRMQTAILLPAFPTMAAYGFPMASPLTASRTGVFCARPDRLRASAFSLHPFIKLAC
jgi:hypothetical protein